MGAISKGSVALGLAGGIVGMYAYMYMSPRTHRDVERNMRKAVSELRDIASDMGKSIKNLG